MNLQNAKEIGGGGGGDKFEMCFFKHSVLGENQKSVVTLINLN